MRVGGAGSKGSPLRFDVVFHILRLTDDYQKSIDLRVGTSSILQKRCSRMYLKDAFPLHVVLHFSSLSREHRYIVDLQSVTSFTATKDEKLMLAKTVLASLSYCSS